MNQLSSSFGALRAFLLTHVKSERGATAVEYGLIVGLIAIVIITAVILLGNNLSGLFNRVGNDV
jgi:pilus assembly protein Flp/PilA